MIGILNWFCKFIISLWLNLIFWLFEVCAFLPNLASSFCEAHFKGNLGTFMGVSASIAVAYLQGLLAGLIIRLVAGRTPITEGEGNSESYEDDEENCDLISAYGGACGVSEYVEAHTLLDDDDC